MDKLQQRKAVKQLAERFLERAKMLGYKGKKADDMALEYFVGATIAAELSGQTDFASYLTLLSAMSVSVRGVFAVREFAAWDLDKEAA
jgi:hypothetical protein